MILITITDSLSPDMALLMDTIRSPVHPTVRTLSPEHTHSLCSPHRCPKSRRYIGDSPISTSLSTPSMIMYRALRWLITKEKIMNHKILIADDEPEIRDLLRLYLENEKYDVIEAENGNEALRLVSEQKPDLVLLDIMMPGMDGYQVLKAIRVDNNVPVIIISAKDEDSQKILGLNLGADDYISKPFRIRELIARIKAVIRRSGRSTASEVRTDEDTGAGADIIKIGRNELNIRTGKVMRGGEEIFLSAVEYRLLLTFAGSRGQLLTRQKILTDMWDSAGDFVNDNTLTVYVRRLRKKLEEEGDEPVIQTVRGIGYRMDAE